MKIGETYYAKDGEKFTIVVVVGRGDRGTAVAAIIYDGGTGDVGVQFPVPLSEEALCQRYLKHECSEEDFLDWLAETVVRSPEALLGEVSLKCQLYLKHLEAHFQELMV